MPMENTVWRKRKDKKQGLQKSAGQQPNFSNEESVLSFDKNENLRLEDKFRLNDLRLLQEAFANHNLTGKETSRKEEASKLQLNRCRAKQNAQPAGNMTLEEFRQVLSDLFGSEYFDDDMELLFNKVDTSCDGFIDWGEFCTYLLLQYKKRDYKMTGKVTFLGQPVIRLCTRNKQEPTSRILAISSPPPLWFLSVSKSGVLTSWDSALHPQKSYEIASDFTDLQAGKRRFKSWVTDAVHLPNTNKIAVATTSRDIHFFDVSTMNLFEEFHLFALNHVPTSFCYWHNKKSPGNQSLLLWGGDNGAVHVLWLLKPHIGVFEKPFSQNPGPTKIYIQELKDHSKLLSYQVIPDVHPEAITKLMYCPEKELVITSSGSSQSSVIIMDINLKGKVYTWKINKGVQCFDYCRAFNLLVTGGFDHKVRLWNEYVPCRPIAVLPEHSMAILDVIIYQPLRQIFSFSKDSVLKVWDISSQTCLQTLVLKFPCVQPGRIQEQGNFPFLLVPTNPSSLLVCYSDYIGILRLAQAELMEGTFFTHKAPISCLIYNSFFQLIVTASEDSTVTIWDVETGTKSLLLSNVHGQEEITCMAFDKSHRKLITGARNGTLKIWNIQNGHNLYKLEPVEEVEITCVLALEEKIFLSVGWNRKIVTYDIPNTNEVYVPANDSWKGGQVHQEDILTADLCPSLGLLATASFDGEIILWNVETQRLYLYLRQCPPTRASTRPHVSSKEVSKAVPRPVSKHQQNREIWMCRSQPPVDKLFFLHKRSAKREAAVLISSEAGTLRWWSVINGGQELGHFYAPSEPDNSVFGLSSDKANSVLVSGDTLGLVQVWDISSYGLQATDQTYNCRPPLLYSWVAHESAVVSVEHLLYNSEPFIASGSSDKTAKLWTVDGKHVGTFGQSKCWKLNNHSTFQDSRLEDSGKHMEGSEENSPQGVDKLEHSAPQREEIQPVINEIQEVNREDKALTPTPEDPPEILSQEHPDPAAGSSSKASLGSVQEESTSKAAAKKERRQLVTDIDVNKCNRFGQICSPFQALITPAVQEIILPPDLVMRMRSNNCATSDLQDSGIKQRMNPGEFKTQGRKSSHAVQE
ncbi:WD repeat-containing protein on Y chromosome isoform X1 [Xenopus laevis]|uniref:WD repeat-containing protein on Y chromosome isoform X1 n=1 Tax=Xenopus laevis TaxID=8355 RepID=A0A8J0TTQ6_XENLA|nr:WD repeat-containing protein on Y chromosome isoform X1 [Xenopus laevis]